jgi:hypothetical protein
LYSQVNSALENLSSTSLTPVVGLASMGRTGMPAQQQFGTGVMVVL